MTIKQNTYQQCTLSVMDTNRPGSWHTKRKVYIETERLHRNGKITPKQIDW